MNKNISEKDLGIIAGLLMGEGNIGLSRKLGKRNQNYNYSYLYSISNTNIKIIEWLKNKTGIGLIAERKRDKNAVNKKHKNVFYWQLRLNEIKEFNKIILPYLIIKNTQAKILLRWFDEIINTNKNKKGFSTKAGISIISAKQEGLKEFLWEEVCLLNKRGILTNEELITIKEIENYYKDLYKEFNYAG